MRESSFDSIFSPTSIAVVGASERKESVGYSILGNLRATFHGPVFAVNPKHTVIQGQPAYASLQALPNPPDLAILCTPAETIPDLVTECGRRGVKGLIIVTAGFREIGLKGRELESRLRARLCEFPQLRMIGPNCLGVVRPSSRLNASFSPVMPRPGRMTLLTQSGALGTAIMDWSQTREIGFATCVSLGNMVNVGMGELIDYFADDDQTDAILLYIEGLDDGQKFVAAARACSRRKPVIAYKSGRFEESSQAAASHTGALASSDAVFDAAFRRSGVERVRSIEELFDCAQLLSQQKHALGNRLAIVTNAGGPGIMASDAWLAGGGQLAELTQETRVQLDRVLPPCWSHGNPIDVLGDASEDRFQAAIQIALRDSQVDALMVIVTPQAMTDPGRIAEIVVAAQQQTQKTIVTSWMGGPGVESGRILLRHGKVPVYEFPEGAAQALHHLVSAGERQRVLCAENVLSNEWQHGATPISSERQRFWHDRFKQLSGLIDEVESKSLLSDYGIPIVPTKVAQTLDEAESLADELGYPVVLKVLSSDISHKTDVGGVKLNLANADSVRAAFVAIHDAVRRNAPNARWDGVAVQPMISAVRGVELLLGMKRDPQFGPVLLLGAGGITAELQKDSVLELLPLDQAAWNHLVHSLRIFPLLEGYRGRPGVDLRKLQDAVFCFAHMAGELPELEAAEINPLLATPGSVIALDARVIARTRMASADTDKAS